MQESGEFDSRKDSWLTRFEKRSQIFVKLSFRELFDSKLCDLHPFENMAIIHYKIGKIFLLIQNSSVVNDTQGTHKYPHHQQQL